MAISVNPDGSVTVPWTTPVFPKQGEHQLQRSSDGGQTFSLVARVPLSPPSADGLRHSLFTDMGTIALGSGNYTYRVDTTYQSNEATVTVVVPAPISTTATESPNDTTAAAITDKNADNWTIGAGAQLNQTLKNGVWFGKGMGTTYYYLDHTLYVLGTDNNWYDIVNTGWTLVGPTKPGAGTVNVQDIDPTLTGKTTILP